VRAASRCRGRPRRRRGCARSHPLRLWPPQTRKPLRKKSLKAGRGMGPKFSWLDAIPECRTSACRIYASDRFTRLVHESKPICQPTGAAVLRAAIVRHILPHPQGLRSGPFGKPCRKRHRTTMAWNHCPFGWNTQQTLQSREPARQLRHARAAAINTVAISS
jgi:hypothetical protein